MARKEAGNVATIDELPPLEPKTMTLSAMIELQVVEGAGYRPRNFNFNITHELAERFRMLFDTLHANGATFDDGRGTHHVDSHADVFRWLLAQMEVS